MSVLIKGMDMPKSCLSCKFKGCGGYDEWVYFCDLTGDRLGNLDNKKAKWQHERRKNCPLVEVSEDAVSPCEVCPLIKEMNENVDKLVGELYGEDGNLKQSNTQDALEEVEPENAYCTEENCEIYQNDLSCERCIR